MTFTFGLDFKMRKTLKTALISSAAVAIMAISPAAFADDTLEIKDFIGSITWSNGPMSVDVKKNKGDTKISGRRSMTIDGGVNEIDEKDCKSSYGSYDLDWFGKKKEGRFGGYDNLEDYPVLNIELPSDATIILSNSVIFTEGTPDIANADLELRHCGKVTLGNIENTLALDSRGSGDVTIGRTGQIAANLRGSGDLEGEDSGDVIVKSHGSGDVELGDIASLEINLHGSGDLEVGDVDGTVDITSHGSGDAELNDVSGSLSYSGNGSGDFEAASITGSRVYLKSHGSGDIDIGGGDVEVLEIIVRGSATVDFSGEAETADLKASGSGDIYVNRVSGVADIKTSGSGDVDIDERG